MAKDPKFTANIPYDKLLELHQEYLDKKHSRLTRTAGNKKDTRTVWFELDASMRAFLSDLLTDTNVSGVRVYLCAYKDKVDNTGPTPIPHKPHYLKRLTVGFVATKNGGSGNHPDYPNSLTGANKNFVMAPPQNHGELCPPDICP